MSYMSAAEFLVTRERVLMRPLSFYENARDVVKVSIRFDKADCNDMQSGTQDESLSHVHRTLLELHTTTMTLSSEMLLQTVLPCSCSCFLDPDRKLSTQALGTTLQ